MCKKILFTVRYSILTLAGCCYFLVSCSKSSTPGGSTGDPNPPKEEKKIVISGYLPNYGMNRFDHKNLQYLDRVNYFSIEPDGNGLFQVSVADSSNLDLLKKKLTTSQQLFLVIGGWVKSQNISAMASDAAKRTAYIQALVSFCKRMNINGVDLDWEDYPGPVNQSLYVTLVKELSTALHAQNILLSVALGVSKADWGYKIRDDVDLINIMIYGQLDASGNQSTMLQTTNALNGYADPGISKSRLLAGVPFFGKRSAAPVSLEYYSIVDQAHPDPSVNKFGEYSFNGRKLLQDKTALLRQNGYAGIVIWDVSQDVSIDSEYSLLKSIYDRNK